MAWIVGIVVLVLLVVSAGFRHLVLGIVALGAIIGGVVYLHNENEDQKARSRIPSSELFFEGVVLNTEYGSYKMSGRLTNRSARFTLTQVRFLVTMDDCPTSDSPTGCVTVGESYSTEYLDIPPGQARDFKSYVHFPSDMKIKSHPQWDYRVSEIKGK